MMLAYMKKYIGKVKLVESDYTNIKITTPEDIQLAELLLKQNAL